MLTTLTFVALAQTCSLSGTVKLQRDGHFVSTEGRVVVYVRRVPKVKTARAGEPHKVLQRRRSADDFEFSEGLKVIVKDEAIEFVNQEEGEPHNVFSETSLRFEIPKTSDRSTGTRFFPDVGTYHVQCDVHDGMRMDLLVVANRFYALADANGAFTIDGLPPNGKYELIAWERNGKEESVEVQCPTAKPVEITLHEDPPPPHRHKDFTPYQHGYRGN